MAKQNSNLYYIPLSVHFLLELSLWLWLLIATLLINVNYLILFLITIFIFIGFSAQEDPIKKAKFIINGKIILFLELFSFLFGIYACYELFGILGFYFQFIFTLGSYLLNYQRVLWLLGFRTQIPETMLVFQK